jgi:ribosomal protein S19
MKLVKSTKALKLVKRSDTIMNNEVVGKGVRVENGRGKVHFRPSMEIVGRKYGELVKTRTPARKRVIGKGSTNKPQAKKGSTKK